MARKFAVLSGKGGAGKSTVSANLGYALSKSGKRVLLVDMDFGLNSLDIVMRCQNSVVFDLKDVIENKCRLKQALLDDKKSNGLYVLLSGSFNPEKDSGRFCETILKEQIAFDYIFFDCPAGVGKSVECALKACDETIVVVTPHYVSVKDALAALKLVQKYDVLRNNVVINRIRGDMVKEGRQMSAVEVFALLEGCFPLGIVPENYYLNGFTRCDSIFFDVLADNLANGKQLLYDYMKNFKGLSGKIRSKLNKNF